MKIKTLLFLAAFLSLSIASFGQAARYDSFANTTTTIGTKTGVVQVVPGASVTVCTFPAATFAGCTKVALCTDSTGGSCSTGSNPVTADSSGNFGFWVAPGMYDYWITVGAAHTGPFHVSETNAILASGNNTLTGANTLQKQNDFLAVGSGTYATCAAAVTAAGAVNKTIIDIRSSYAGAVCPADMAYNNPNITVFDWSGVQNPNSAPFNGTSINGNDGNVQWLFRSNFGKQTFAGSNQAIVNGYWITTLTNSTPPVGSTVDGISAEVDTFGTMSANPGNLQAAEHSVSIGSTGATVTNAAGAIGYVVSAGGSTTAVTNAMGFWARGCTTLSGSTPTNCYGVKADDQGNKGGSRSYAIYGVGRWLVGYSSTTAGAAIQFEDSANTAHQTFILDSGGVMNFQSPTATGIALEDNTGAIKQLITSTGTQFRGPINIGSSATLLVSPTAPTVSSGFGTSPSIVVSNGTAAFTINVGTGGTATNGVIALPNATTGWHCMADDLTTQSATVFYTHQIATTASTATIANFNTAGAQAAWVASDVLRVSCFAY